MHSVKTSRNKQARWFCASRLFFPLSRRSRGHRFGVLCILSVVLTFLYWHSRRPREFHSSCPELTFQQLWKAPKVMNVTFGLARIPALVHYYYTEEAQISPKDWHVLQQCAHWNPSFTFVIWNAKSVEVLLQSYSIKHFSVWQRADSNYKKQLASILILYFHGGVFLDFSVECRASLLHTVFSQLEGPARLNSTCLFNQEDEYKSKIVWDREYLLNGNFIFCEAKHAFLHYLLNTFQLDEGKVMLDLSQLTDHFQQFQLTNSAADSSFTQVLLAPKSWYAAQAMRDYAVMHLCAKLGHWRRLACEESRMTQMMNRMKSQLTAFFVERYYEQVQKPQMGIDLCKTMQNNTALHNIGVIDAKYPYDID